MRSLLAVSVSFLIGTPAFAEEHLVRAGETLPQIGQLYYGDSEIGVRILSAANRIDDDEDTPLAPGQRITIPVPRHSTVAAGETWERLAERTLGAGSRADLLARANGADPEVEPDVGTEFVVPIVLTYFPGRRDTITNIARRFLPEERAAARLLRRYNDLRMGRPPQGRPLLVPLPRVRLTASGQQALDVARERRSDGTRVVVQEEISQALPGLDDLFREGRYVELVAAASQLIGRPEATGNQRVTLNRLLAYAYVALEREDLAEAAFREALAHQPDLELSPVTTSPKILRVLRRARGEPPTEPPKATESRPGP